MKIYREISDLSDFEPWSGAVDTYERICDASKDEEFIQQLDDVYPDGITETQLNDLLWFEEEWCYQLVGLNNYGYEPMEAGDVYGSQTVIDYMNNWIEEKNQETPSRCWYVNELMLEDDITEWLEDNQDSDDAEEIAEKWLNDVGKELIAWYAEYENTDE